MFSMLAVRLRNFKAKLRDKQQQSSVRRFAPHNAAR
jgi:hypothetical protein